MVLSFYKPSCELLSTIDHATMPQAGKDLGPNLSIELDDNNLASFGPGDIITGRVVRQAHIITPRAWTEISLFGRAKGKLVVNRGQSGYYFYRSRYSFFAHEDTAKRLHHGPIHIPPNGDPQSWQFAITIPTKMNPRAVCAGHEQRHSYLPLTSSTVEALPLPVPFRDTGSEWNTRYEAFVEYYLEATFHYEHDGGAKFCTATLPLNVGTAPGPLTQSGYDLRRWRPAGFVATPRLLPGMQDMDLTLRQRTQKLFGSASIPRLAYTLEVEGPSVLQLGHPGPIPFRVRVLPDVSRTTAAVADSKNPPSFVLASLDVRLRAETSVIAPGGWGGLHTAADDRKFDFCLRAVPWRTAFGGEALVLPSRADESPLDVGALIKLRLEARGACTNVGDGGFGSTLYPSFTMFNMKHSHWLRWEITLAVVGETSKHTGELAITVKAPSREAVANSGVAASRTSFAASTTVNGTTGGLAALVDTEESLPAYEPSEGRQGGVSGLPEYATEVSNSTPGLAAAAEAETLETRQKAPPRYTQVTK